MGSLTRRARCRRQDFTPHIHMAESDFMAITRNGALCDDTGGLGPVEFEAVMRDQIRLYTQVPGPSRRSEPGHRRLPAVAENV